MYKNVKPFKVLNELTHFYKNFVRKNFLERMLEFNSNLTKKRVFDKKVAKSIFYIPNPSFTPTPTHKTQNAFFKFLM